VRFQLATPLCAPGHLLTTASLPATRASRELAPASPGGKHISPVAQTAGGTETVTDERVPVGRIKDNAQNARRRTAVRATRLRAPNWRIRVLEPGAGGTAARDAEQTGISLHD
jgi:hypothetical protein